MARPWPPQLPGVTPGPPITVLTSAGQERFRTGRELLARVIAGDDLATASDAELRALAEYVFCGAPFRACDCPVCTHLAATGRVL